MAITYQAPQNDDVTFDGFAPAMPPFAALYAAYDNIDYDCHLHVRAIAAIHTFIESGLQCASKDFDNEAHAQTAHEVLKRVAPDGVSVIRRGSEIYLMRR